MGFQKRQETPRGYAEKERGAVQVTTKVRSSTHLINGPFENSNGIIQGNAYSDRVLKQRYNIKRYLGKHYQGTRKIYQSSGYGYV